jgi:[ribosomal protein S5]-alanine N-acetyltransferase
MGLPDDRRIESERLDLVLLDRPLLAALLDGRRAEVERALGASLPPSWPGERARWLIQLRLDQIGEDPASEPWLLRAIVLRERAIVIGHVGFHGPPDVRGRVEIGYSIFADHRRRGYASEAARALAAWALGRGGARTLVASVAPDNEPSLALVRRAGFRQVGTQWDELDGEELVFEVPLDRLR